MILVTGGTGLLGSRLLFDLVQSGHFVRAVKRPQSRMNCVNRYFNNHPELLSKIEWVEADITDYYSIEDALRDVQMVYHCAARVSFYSGDRDKILNENISGTANVVNACLENGAIRLLYVSSVAALGRSEQGENIDESSSWKTSPYNSIYAISKYAAEREVWRGMAEGLNAVIINPSIILGPGNWKTDSSMLFTRIWNGLKFYSDGINGFVGLEDTVQCMIRLMESGVRSERFIVSAENMGFRELFNLIADGLHKPRPSIHAGPLLSGIAWRLDALRSAVTGKKPAITRENVVSASKRSYYNNQKIKRSIGIEFKPVNYVVNETADIFLADKK